MSDAQGGTLGRRDAKGHGGGVRGADLADRSVQFEGRFGRMFRSLPPARFDSADLRRLASVGQMTAEAETDTIDGQKVRIAKAESEPDDEENFGVPAGYTYFGQFIDHDLTFDPASSLQGENDPDALTDFRTPRLDLDSVYGRGPDDQPYMFDADGRHFLLGRALTRNGTAPPEPAFDLPRTPQGRAIIGDKRNDENVIVSQLHGLFLRFHNAVADRFGDLPFPEIQRLVRWHYQWAVLHDFLPRVVGPDRVAEVLPHLRSGRTIFEDPPRLDFYKPRHAAYIPVEFSVAAYRFGHSMVRPIYRLSQEFGNDDADPTHTKNRLLIFASKGKEGLNGFREFPSAWAIDWRLFLEFDGEKLSPENTRERKIARIQPAYKFDTSLVNPLDFLPEFCKVDPATQDLLLDADQQPIPREAPFADMPEIPNLALRNLLRGQSMGLPSGQAVARAMGLVPLADKDIRIGKATVGDTFSAGDGGNPSIIEFGESFRDNAPLWAYVLAEAQAQWAAAARAAVDAGDADAANALPVRLGPVGGRIVAETLVGLLLADSHSFLSQSPGWTPELAVGGRFGLPDLVASALAWPPTPKAASTGGWGRERRSVLPIMRIQARPGSAVERAYWRDAMRVALAKGLSPDPDERLIFQGGKVVPEMAFQNVFLGADAAWNAEAIESIDSSILAAMRHKGLNNVMQQYFPGKRLVCERRPSIRFEPPSVKRFEEADVRRIVTRLFEEKRIAHDDLDRCIFNLLLPAGAVLALGKLVSTDGLGGFHGSVHVQHAGQDVTLYYSANVLSERLPGGENGIVAFDAPWKNVVATLYHEMNEFRTDPDVEDDRPGWASVTGQEVGDEPLLKVDDLGLIFKEIAAGPNVFLPVQFLYSNAAKGAEGPIPAPHP